MSNLEPIEESDLDLESKFLGGESKTSAEIIDQKKPNYETKEIDNSGILKERAMKGEGRSIEKEKTYSKILSKVKAAQPVLEEKGKVKDDAKEVFAVQTSEAKVDKLVKLAMSKGVVHAVKVAKHLDDNYTLDEFHDKLMADDFYEALISKGLIKNL